MATSSTTIGQGGRIVIPAAFREKLGIEEGDEVTLSCDERGIHIATADLVLSVLKDIASKRTPKHKKGKIVDEFLKERRAEAHNE